MIRLLDTIGVLLPWLLLLAVFMTVAVETVKAARR